MKKVIELLVILQLLLAPILIEIFVYDFETGVYVVRNSASPYIIDKVGNIRGVYDYLSTSSIIYEKGAVWQRLIRDRVPYMPIPQILVYILGKTSSISYLKVAYFPATSITFFLIFILLLKKVYENVIKSINLCSNLNKRFLKVLIFLSMTASIYGFLSEMIIAKLFVFQDHAVALIGYLAIIYIMTKSLFNFEFNHKQIVLILILFIFITWTHHRFPILVIANIFIFGMIYYLIANISGDKNLKYIGKNLMMIGLVFVTITFLQSFYLTYLKFGKKSIFVNIKLAIIYLQKVLAFRGFSESVHRGVSFSTIYPLAKYWKITSYLQGYSMLCLSICLVYILIRQYKATNPTSLLFLWSFTSSITIFLSYFTNYGTLVGLQIYDAYLFYLFILIPLTEHLTKDNIQKTLIFIIILLLIVSSISYISARTFDNDYKYRYSFYPHEAKNEALYTAPFIIHHIGTNETRSIAGSIITSATIYEFIASHNVEKVKYIFPRFITYELQHFYFIHHDIYILYKELQGHDDYVLITNYECNNGISGDVNVLYLKMRDSKKLCQIFKVNANTIYNSNMATVIANS